MSVVGGVSQLQLQEPFSVVVENTNDNPVPTTSTKADGDWGYLSGIDGTVIIPPGARVLQLTVAASTNDYGFITINGGSEISVPPASFIEIRPQGNLIDAEFVFTSTISYFIEYVI